MNYLFTLQLFILFYVSNMCQTNGDDDECLTIFARSYSLRVKKKKNLIKITHVLCYNQSSKLI